MQYPDDVHSLRQWLSVFSAARLRIRRDKDVDVVVQELGSDKPGDIPAFNKYLSPDIAVITAVGLEHMEYFKTTRGSRARRAFDRQSCQIDHRQSRRYRPALCKICRYDCYLDLWYERRGRVSHIDRFWCAASKVSLAHFVSPDWEPFRSIYSLSVNKCQGGWWQLSGRGQTGSFNAEQIATGGPRSGPSKDA